MPFEDTWERIRKKTGIRTFKELADIVGVQQPSISKWKSKNDFPEKWAYRIATKYDLNIKWILTGEGSEIGTGTLDQLFIDLSEWIEEVSGTGNNEWFINQLYAAFPMFKEWRIGKENSKYENSDFPTSKII